MRLILNQVCVGHGLEHAWFLENAFAHNVYGMYACVYMCNPKAINVLWCDIDPI